MHFNDSIGKPYFPHVPAGRSVSQTDGRDRAIIFVINLKAVFLFMHIWLSYYFIAHYRNPLKMLYTLEQNRYN